MSMNGIIQVGLTHIYLLQGDITTIATDAIVNAANSFLSGGGGVDGAIHQAGGPSLMQELNVIRAQIGSCPAGEAVVTSAGKLPARFVFHAVGPRYRNGQHGEAEKLAACYKNCLDLAADRELASISFPSISTGVYGYPIVEATQIALRTVTQWFQSHTSTIRNVKLIQFSAADHAVYIDVARELHNSSYDV